MNTKKVSWFKENPTKGKYDKSNRDATIYDYIQKLAAAVCKSDAKFKQNNITVLQVAPRLNKALIYALSGNQDIYNALCAKETNDTKKAWNKMMKDKKNNTVKDSIIQLLSTFLTKENVPLLAQAYLANKLGEVTRSYLQAAQSITKVISQALPYYVKELQTNRQLLQQRKAKNMDLENE